MGILADRIPLIDHDHGGLARLMHQTRNLGILLGHALIGVNEDQAHVRTGNRINAAHVGELLHAVVHLGLLAHACGVNEYVFAVFILIIAVDGVTGGTGYIGYDHPLLPQNIVEQAGLAHIGLAHNGDLDHVLLLFLLRLRGEVLHAQIQQVAGAVTMEGADGDGVT